MVSKTLVDKIQMADAKTFDLLFAEENANNGVATPDYSKADGQYRLGRPGNPYRRFQQYQPECISQFRENRFSLGLGYIHDEGIIKQNSNRMLLSFEMK